VIRVEEVDLQTAPDEPLLAVHRIERACDPELKPGEPLGAADAIAYYRHQPTSHTTCLWLADGGFAALFFHGPAAAFTRLMVHPERRREGIGTALLGTVGARVRDLGGTALHGRHATEGGAAFAARAGARDGQRIVESLLDLRAASLEPRPVPDGWRLETWLRRVPDEHIEAFVRARPAIDDAPTPDEVELPPITVESERASEESLARRGREMRVTVAMREDGEIGAFTELRVSRGSTTALTDDTATVAEHRRKGLAHAVKVESLRRLRDDHPEVTAVTTSNAEENVAMLRVNGSVGFRPTVTVTTTSLEL
jgi:GNAT superfamily N-acetyltransferase